MNHSFPWLFPDSFKIPWLFNIFSKFPDFSLTGKSCLIFPGFPGFPVPVGTLVQGRGWCGGTSSPVPYLCSPGQDRTGRYPHPPTGVPPDGTSEYLLCSWQYTSCSHAGGLSCSKCWHQPCSESRCRVRGGGFLITITCIFCALGPFPC